MSFDILESLYSTLGGPITRQLSTSLGETEDATRSAVRYAGPTMLAGLIHQATTPNGAADLFRAVQDERVDPGIVGKLGGLLGNRGSVESVQGLGESLGSMVFGNRGSAVTNALSQVAGIRPNSALSLLSMGLPILFGMLRKQTTVGRLDAPGLASLLFSQRNSLERAGLDSRITNALGFGSLSSLLGAIPGVSQKEQTTSRERERTTKRVERAPARVPVQEAKKRPGWLPWAIAAGVAALAMMLMVNRPEERTRTAQAPPAASVPDERIRLASAETKVYFNTADSTIDVENRRKIAGIAHSANSENRSVAVTGYADSTGDYNQNVAIAQTRAEAVKDALVAEGLDESRIVLDPPARVTGSGTPEEARRVDIEVR